MKKIAPAVLALLAADVAHADTRIVAEIASDGDSGRRTVTVLLRGDQARREEDSGRIVLLDRNARKVWVLNLAAKTYWSQSLDDYRSPAAGPGLSPPRAAPHASVKLDTVKDGAPDRAPSPSAVGASAATQCSLSGSFSWEPRAFGGEGGFGRGGGFPGGGGRRRGGGFPGGGEFPGGGAPRGGGESPRSLPRLSVAGQVWTAPWDTLTDIPEKAMRDLLVLVTEEALPPGSPMRNAWQDQLARKKALPLAAAITTTRYASAPRDDAPGTAATPGAVRFTVTAVEKGLTLDAALFRIPEGFTEVSAPRTP